MQHIGLLYNPLSDISVRLSDELVEWLRLHGRSAWRGTSEDGRENPAAIQALDLLVALGGDGTALRAARLAIPFRVPVLTVALGRLNFMAELTADNLKDGLTTLLAGDGWYDERALIEVRLLRQHTAINMGLALNEVVISRGDINRVLTLDIEIDDIPLTTYRADGVLVSTATGSTAYALSAGGPIVDPRSKSLVLVPVAAHLTAVPSMVLHEDTVITITKRSPHRAAMSVDGGESSSIQQHDRVQIQRCSQVCILARVRPAKQLYVSFVQRLRRE